MGALGAALGSMVANLSSHKRGWDERWEEFSNWAEKGNFVDNVSSKNFVFQSGSINFYIEESTHHSGTCSQRYTSPRFDSLNISLKVENTILGNAVQLRNEGKYFAASATTAYNSVIILSYIISVFC